MKYLILIALTVAGIGQAYAGEKEVRAQLDKFLQKNGPKLTNAPNPAPAPVLRNAPIKISVNKTTIEKLADGTFNSKEEVVCQVIGETTPVYDVRQNTGGPIAVTERQCNATYMGKPVTLKFVEIMALANFVVHPDESSVDVKAAFMGAWIWNGTNSENIDYIGSITRDLNTSSIILKAGQDQILTCENPADSNDCTVSRAEAFYVTYEFMDQQP